MGRLGVVPQWIEYGAMLERSGFAPAKVSSERGFEISRWK
jgi:hypothetical protein